MNETPTLSDQPGPSTLKQRRTDLLANREWVGSALCPRLAEIIHGELARLWVELDPSLPMGWSLLTVGGTARGAMCPESDVDVLLLHPRKTAADLLKSVAEQLWYPLWDAGLTVSPLVHSRDSLSDLIRHDLAAATTVLDVCLVGGEDCAADIVELGRRNWRNNAKRFRASLVDDVAQRQDRFGDVGALLEPELKDGHGGLRDLHVLSWLAMIDDNAAVYVERRAAELAGASADLLDARVELHRATRRSGNKLLLQEQDAAAAALSTDADTLMRNVSEAGHTVAWAIERVLRRSRRSHTYGRARTVAPGVVVAGDDAAIAEQTSIDAGVVMRIAAAAAALDVDIAEPTLDRVAAATWLMPSPWPAALRRDFVALLGAGTSMLPVVEALDHARIMERLLPEWGSVRFKPQRNAFHQFTVDRHLLQCAANAARLVRRVARPDLLLVGALLHDIGKGYPGDHTEAGEPIVREIGSRMGFSEADVDALVALERLHLLLPEIATRRDLTDPGTIGAVAFAVGDAGLLDLLHALTVADSLATGPSAWSDWKARLVEDLVVRTRAALAGERIADLDPSFPDEHAALTALAADGQAHVRADGEERCTVVAVDRRGLFRIITGVLAVHGVDIVAANVWTSDDGIAVDEFDIRRRLGGETNWKRVQTDLRHALAGDYDLAGKLADRAKTYRHVDAASRSAHPPRAEVRVENGWSAAATVVEVRAPDGVGMLHKLSALIEELGLDIRKAKVATLGQEVVDVFYVDRLADDRADAILDRLREELAID